MIQYFDYDILNEKHNEVLKKSGGLSGVHDKNLLMGFLDFIRNDDYYPTFEQKLTHLVFSIAKNHGFVDGNKRTSIVAGAFFLEINSFDQYTIDLFMQEMQNVVLLVASNILEKDELEKIIYDIVNFATIRDETKLIYVRHLGDSQV